MGAPPPRERLVLLRLTASELELLTLCVRAAGQAATLIQSGATLVELTRSPEGQVAALRLETLLARAAQTSAGPSPAVSDVTPSVPPS